ncbi:hypothetical protein GCM10025856_17630 [Methylophaga marina]|uniref:PepSY domain-containing protein n=1 Tax=Methylophaga marina TaxID=45495 RepID=A0ABN0TZ62_9GAMM|nr:PepSY-associated TM helix domain-containing protein [Methylophaga marina]BDZ74044.1 hypothetical protein GCM10025856_17630 [Methylophaga marina]
MRKARQLWLDIHTYLGLSIGLLLVLLGLTGSILVFYLQFDIWLNPDIEAVSTAPVRQQQAVFDRLHQQFPTRTDSWRIEQPLHPGWPIMARYYTPVETRDSMFAPLMVTLDPVTRDVTSERFWGEFAMTWIYNLHYTLLLDKNGKTFIGTIGLISLISLISGMVLWWPGWLKLRQVLAWRLRSSYAKKVFDLHILSGSYGFIVLLMLSLTGAALALPTQTHDIIRTFSPLASSPDLTRSLHEKANKPVISADAAVKSAFTVFPDAELRWVESPGSQKNSWRVVFYQQGEPSRRFPRTQVWVNAYNGQIVASRDGLADKAGDKILNWLHPLHNGEVFGLTGRIIVFISGFVPLILFITGLLRWQQKRRAKQRTASRHV